MELATLELDCFEARTHEYSVALDKREAELLKTNTALNNLIERDQARKEQARLQEEEVARRNSLEYSVITLGLFALFSFTFLIDRFKLPPWLVRLSLFLPFLVFFEFLLVLTDPFIESVTENEPLTKLLINTTMATLIFPAHSFFERLLKRRVLKDELAEENS